MQNITNYYPVVSLEITMRKRQRDENGNRYTIEVNVTMKPPATHTRARVSWFWDKNVEIKITIKQTLERDRR